MDIIRRDDRAHCDHRNDNTSFDRKKPNTTPRGEGRHLYEWGIPKFLNGSRPLFPLWSVRNILRCYLIISYSLCSTRCVNKRLQSHYVAKWGGKFLCIWGILGPSEGIFEVRTWSFPSHIPLTPLYLRRVAPSNRSWAEGPASARSSDWKILWWPWSDWLFTMIRKVAQTFYSGCYGMALRESYHEVFSVI